MKRHKTRHRGVYYRLDSRGQRRYVVWFEDSEGKGRFETLPLGTTEKQAVEYRSTLVSKMSKGERVVPTSTRLDEYMDAWLDEQESHLAPKTIKSYREGFARVPAWLKRKRLSDVTVDDVARMIAELKRAGKMAWTIRGTLTPLSRLFARAVRAGHLGVNPVKGLDKSERPKSDQRKMRILSSAEIEKVLPAVPDRYRALVTTLVFTGMRISEALELRWADVDFTTGLVRVQASKTAAGVREIVLMPSLAKVLREHKLASSHSKDSDLVFSSARGTRLNERNVYRRGIDKAFENLEGVERVTLHELRHTFASILIGQGMDVTFVADQLGHADPAITLRTYAKLFDPRERREEARTKLETAFAGVIV